MQTKLNSFITSNNLTSGVIKHQQIGKLYLIGRLPETELEIVYTMAAEAINTLKPVCTVYKKTDYFRKVEQLLSLNGVATRFVNTAPKGGSYANSLLVTFLPEAINYDANQK